jgi:hypothetical protein
VASLLFYRNPVPLSREAHKTLRIKPSASDFTFAANTNSVPLAAAEFYDAQRDYPIVFAGTGDADVSPVALLGLRQSENLFVGKGKQWDSDYVPVFARCYPFVLARGNGNEGGDYLVCVDDASPAVVKSGGEALFDESGQESEYLRRNIDLLSEFQGHMKRTREFTQRLKDAGLLKDITLQVVPEGGEPLSLQGVQVVDEAKLMALEDAKVTELFRLGELGWIYAHLASLRNVQRLSKRLSRRLAKAA